MQNALNERFHALLNKDKGFIKDYIVNWEYIDKSRKRQANSEVVEAADFFRFNGNEDLKLWFSWLNYEQNSYLPESLTSSLIQQSQNIDVEVFKKLNLTFDCPLYEKNIGLDNALDFVFPNIYPSPKRYKIVNVLDFGAGFGRQAALYTKPDSPYHYIAMDAIPKSYCLQYTYFKALDRNVADYLDHPDGFKLNLQGKGFSHIPTWRYDLIPDGSLDLVICVQVLPELSSELVKKMIAEFSRMLKPGGMIYIRDHKEKWVPAGTVDKDAVLRSNGFVKEFEAHVVDKGDIHGIPRIWRKIDPQVKESQERTQKEKLRQSFANADAMTGGLLSKINQKLGVKL
ncbi:MAG: class I SAM-dependent methyltransferase [Chitinophagales bacterium]